MLLSIDGRFAYLAMTKTGSTSVENAIRSDCPIFFSRDHRVTHMPAHHFERFLRPYLKECGFAGIDTVCQIRHPVDWLESWWRYRSKPGDWEREVDTSDVSFEAFALGFIEGADAPYLNHIHRPQAFLCDDAGTLQVDIVFRYEEMDVFAAFLSARLNRQVSFKRHNTSPRRMWTRLGRNAKARVEAYFAPELDIWENKTARTPDARSR